MKTIDIEQLTNVTGGAGNGTAWKTYDFADGRRVRLYKGGKAEMETATGGRFTGTIVKPFKQHL